MNTIKDIRVYRSRTENTAGSSLPHEFANYELNMILRRITMKLRENSFTMGDFNHLYVNLTTYEIGDKIAPSPRKDSNSAWFRYYDAQISEELYDALETPGCIPSVIEIVEQVLIKFFCTAQFGADGIRACVSEAVEQGENMLMRFKEKRASKNKAVIYLRYLDNGRYFPLLRVYDTEDTVLLERDLPETNSLDAYGEIQLSAKKVT
ncbi:MAG: hypothetical protein ILP19_00385, partial [Oscillospiraceae bacterium]|nr:hypothetical protein [Oscillospiraceae bacterium]